MTDAATMQMLEALKLASNVLYLLEEEVDNLGCRAAGVKRKVEDAIAIAEGREPKPWTLYEADRERWLSDQR